MAKRIGILTSGGDCPGLNAAIRGVAKVIYEKFNSAEIIGVEDGYRGLIEGDWHKVEKKDLSGILTLGGTILGTSRQPFKLMEKIEKDNVDKVSEMIRNYEKMRLDCLVTLGGNGTHKTANLLSQKGLNIIGLPKTIDNDIFGTDITFGFHTAVDIATEAIDRVHTTADSHGRIMIVEIMGHKVGWLNLYAGIAGGADIIIIPEIPYDIDSIIEAVKKRDRDGKNFSIIAVAEGAINKKEAKMGKKDFKQHRESMSYYSVSHRIASKLQEKVENDVRVVIPGHIVRGGSPSPYDRILATRFGVHAAMMIQKKIYGRTVALKGSDITDNNLSDIAGKLKSVPKYSEMVKGAKALGINFGE
ncbi:MAG: ATP-dependent 6-phosphofructokinase [Clostridiales bacterium]|nr:ATP-dependent 6-phosphofructokinase [Clostridiales bacterium]